MLFMSQFLYIFLERGFCISKKNVWVRMHTTLVESTYWFAANSRAIICFSNPKIKSTKD